MMQITIKLIATQVYNAPPRSAFTSKKKQNGITLIMVLIFMVTLSLIAAIGMRGVITGDKAVANERDRALSFQAAESAAREAIAAIKDSARTVAYPVTLPLGGNAEHWRTTSGITAAADCKDPIPLTDAGVKRYKWDKNKDAANPNCSIEASSKFNNAVKPRYVIELMPGVAISATQTDCWYRVTSRATGGTQEADVILQVMVSNTITGVPSACI